jgi:two-component system response regulator VicR
MTTPNSTYSAGADVTGQPARPTGSDGSPTRAGVLSRPTILVVDDDPALARVMAFNLEQEGYDVLTAGDGETALNMVQQAKPALVLLDVLLPGISGFEVCGRIRESSAIPIVMVTVKATEQDVVRGLDLGADDYLSKPFDMGVLLARVKTVLRRAQAILKPRRPAFSLGALRIDFDAQQVTVGGKQAELTRTEYRLICLLARNPGRLMTADYLLTEVWGPEYSGDSHVLSVAVARLRKKIGDDSRNPKYVVTRPGVGYMLKKPQPEERRNLYADVSQGSPRSEPILSTPR